MLTFNEERHEYRYAGVVVPSVTQILAPLSDWSKIPPGTLEHARQRGTAVHRMIELDVANDLDESSVHGEMLDYLEQWREFRVTTAFKFEACELRLYSKRYGYAGTMDLLGAFPQTDAEAFYRFMKTLLDTKCGAILPVAGPQLAAYENLLIENGYGESFARRCLDLKPKAWKLTKPYTNPNDLRVFLSALTLYNFRKEHGLG